MPGNSSEFYRGKRKKAGPALIVSIVVLSLIAFVVLLFYGLQKYIVVTNSGLHLDLPILADKQTTQSGDDGTAVREFETVNAELIVGEPDYSNVRATAGEGAESAVAIASAVGCHGEANGVQRPDGTLGADGRRCVQHIGNVVDGIQFVLFQWRGGGIVHEPAQIDFLQ